MKKNVAVVSVNAPVYEAARIMKNRGIGSVVVIEGNEAKGIVTERDIVRKIVAERKPYDIAVKEIMSSPLIVILPETTVEEAAKIMHRHGIKRLPVIDRNGVLRGIISENDLARLLPSLIDLVEEKARIEG